MIEAATFICQAWAIVMEVCTKSTADVCIDKRVKLELHAPVSEHIALRAYILVDPIKFVKQMSEGKKINKIMFLSSSRIPPSY